MPLRPRFEATELTYALLRCKSALPMTFSQLEAGYVDHYQDRNLSNYVITRLDLCKEKRSPYHEYVLAHVSRGEGQHTCGILKAERMVSAADKNNLKLASHVSSSCDIPASDRVEICGSREFDKAPVLRSADLFDAKKTCSIHEFIAAGIAIGESRPDYDLVVGQCYWFAGLFFLLLGGDDALENSKEKRKWSLTGGNERTPGKFGKLYQLVTPGQLRKASQALAPELLNYVRDLECRLPVREKQPMEKGDQRGEEAQGERTYADRTGAAESTRESVFHVRPNALNT